MILHINIEDLLEKRKIESNRIEFKKGWNPTKIYQSICAFANDFDNIGGGYILVGVEEENGIAKRPVCGVSPKELDKLLCLQRLTHRDKSDAALRRLRASGRMANHRGVFHSLQGKRL